MQHGDALAQGFEKRLRFRPVSHVAEINDQGLVFGAGTILAPMGRDAYGAPSLALEKDGDRVLALLAAAYGSPVLPGLLSHIAGASAYWRRGEKALANIRLAFASLPRCDDRESAYRLFLAEELLDDGMPPQALMKALGFYAPERRLEKRAYNEEEPRVPRGNGDISGEWTRDGSGPAEPSSKPNSFRERLLRFGRALAPFARSLFAAATNSRFLTSLGSLAGELAAPAIVLGAVFIPSRNRAVVEGTFPGQTDLFYSWDRPAGALRLYHHNENGREVVADCRMGRDGVFRDVDKKVPVARLVNDSLVLDADMLAEPRGDARSGEAPGEPKLCPDPGPDAPHGASEAAWAYQELISRLNNPQRPLKRGDAVRLYNPKSRKDVVFDDCRESDGTMIEAKGRNYAWQLHASEDIRKKLDADFLDQARRQVQAAEANPSANGPRDIEWYFAEEEVMERARKIFSKERKLQKIKLFYVPYKQDKE